NIPAIRLVEQLGLPQLSDFSAKLGLPLPAPGNLTLALGTAEVSLLNLTAAYGVFANQGIQVRPRGVQAVEDPQGRRVWQPEARQQVILSPAQAAVVTDMLRAVVLEGTARKARDLPLPVAGKTGTTDQYHDALFVGFSPSLAVGVWVGRDGSGTLGAKETGSRAALPIWIEFMASAMKMEMESASQSEPRRQFPQPEETLRIFIDPESGVRVPQDSSRGRAALFIKGSEPGWP
ncbi:MAG: penicillin-binding transpeptidase domain-containing protein, partial [Desulfobacterales bacterium]